MVTEAVKKQKTKPKKVNNLRHAEYYSMQETFDELFARAGKKENFGRLMDLILSRDNILLAYRNMKGNTGSVTPGTDRLTIHDVEKFTPDGLVAKVRNIIKNYRPRTVRRKEIPKPYDPTKTRPLGIPCIWDRLIQQCILQVLEPICEAKFSDNSYGFRPNRSCENAIAAAYKLMQRSHMQYAVEFDIKGFFDNVDHSKLLRQLWALGVKDRQLLYVIKRILKAPIQLEDGTVVTPTAGTPQGGIISPLLANVVLNELDWWLESQWQENPIVYNRKAYYDTKGRRIKSHGYEAMRKTRLKEMYMVRYADDFRIFCPSADVAYRAKIAVTQWLKERLRLDISPEKTRVVNLKTQYSEFLGIKMQLRPKKGGMVVHSRVSSKAMKRIQTVAKEKAKAIVRPQHGTTDVHAVHDYNAFVMGVHNYYRMATAVSVDFSRLSYPAAKILYRLGKRLKKEPQQPTKGAVADRYGSSAQTRYLKNLPIAPIGYVQTKPPMFKRQAVQKYTPEGRQEIHTNLEINTSLLKAMAQQILGWRSAQYADNRLSLFCAQYGKCAVTGQPFQSLADIHCHHKLPRAKGGTDQYNNLVLVREPVHLLIHATTDETIAKHLAILNLSKRQISKLNKLRIAARNTPISI